MLSIHCTEWYVLAQCLKLRQRSSPDLLWYLLILAAPSAASLGPQGLGGLQKPILVFSSACPLWQLQWVSKWSKREQSTLVMAETANQTQTFRNTQVTSGWCTEVVEDTNRTDSQDRSTSETHRLSLGLGTSRKSLIFKCVFYIWVLKSFLGLLLSGQTRVPLRSLQPAAQGYSSMSVPKHFSLSPSDHISSYLPLKNEL